MGRGRREAGRHAGARRAALLASTRSGGKAKLHAALDTAKEAKLHAGTGAYERACARVVSLIAHRYKQEAQSRMLGAVHIVTGLDERRIVAELADYRMSLEDMLSVRLADAVDELVSERAPEPAEAFARHARAAAIDMAASYIIRSRGTTVIWHLLGEDWESWRAGFGDAEDPMDIECALRRSDWEMLVEPLVNAPE